MTATDSYWKKNPEFIFKLFFREASRTALHCWHKGVFLIVLIGNLLGRKLCLSSYASPLSWIPEYSWSCCAEVRYFAVFWVYWHEALPLSLWLVFLVERIPGSLWSARSCTHSHVWDASVCSCSLVNSCTAVLWSLLSEFFSSECLATASYLVLWYVGMLVLYIALHPCFKKGHSSSWRHTYLFMSGWRKQFFFVTGPRSFHLLRALLCLWGF